MVHFTKLSAAALLVPAAYSAPVEKRQTNIDADILQLALTLEHLENYFYTDALAKFPESDFLAAGFSSDYYNNLKYVAEDETDHVELLSSALTAAGATPVAAGTYDFPYTDVKGFVGLSAILEGVGAAAYLGAAPAITSKEYLGVAGSILVTEAIHTSLQRFNLGMVAAANPYGSALSPDSAYTIAAAFITSLPATNPALPFKAYPTLTATQGIPAAPGITFTFTAPAGLPSTFFVTFVCGLVTQSQAATVANGMITTTIPTTVSGQTYALLTSSNVTAIMDPDVIAGPAILEVTPNAPQYSIAP